MRFIFFLFMINIEKIMYGYIKSTDNLVNPYANYLKTNSIARSVVYLLIILYATRVAPPLPPFVNQLMANQYFRLFIFTLVIWTAQESPATSLLIAIAFMLTMNAANGAPLWEFVENVNSPADPVTAPNMDVAMDAAQSMVDQAAQPVDEVIEKQETVVIQPQVIQKADGSSAVVNPSVLVAPAVVTAPDGNSVLVQPQVETVGAEQTSNDLDQALNTPQSQPVLPTLLPEESQIITQPQTQMRNLPNIQMTGCLPQRTIDYSKVRGHSHSGNYGMFTPMN